MKIDMHLTFTKYEPSFEKRSDWYSVPNLENLYLDNLKDVHTIHLKTWHVLPFWSKLTLWQDHLDLEHCTLLLESLMENFWRRRTFLRKNFEYQTIRLFSQTMPLTINLKVPIFKR